MSFKRAWTPLRHKMFREVWIARHAASNIGTWMQTVGASWLMTTLSASPLMVALVQTASSLPIFLVGLPAGAVADLVDRRRMLLVTQSWMLGAAALLGFLSMAGMVGPWWLLALTFALGLGASANGPAWQAMIPDLVPHEELPAAVALNSMQFNIARAIRTGARGSAPSPRPPAGVCLSGQRCVVHWRIVDRGLMAASLHSAPSPEKQNGAYGLPYARGYAT